MRIGGKILKRKNLTIIFFALLMLLSVTGCKNCKKGGEQVSGGGSKNPDCAHNWEGSETTPATCTEGGVWTYVCKECGQTKDETISSLGGHIEVVDQATSATCTKDGYTEGKHCSRCNQVIVAQTVIPATGHNEVVLEAVAPQCEYGGYTEGKRCTVCNTDTVPQERISSTGHTEETVEGYAATCYLKGLNDGKRCTVCESTLLSQTEIEPLEHEFDANNICTKCHDPKASEGLQFVYDSTTNKAELYGIGSCTDTDIVVPRYYNEKEVTIISDGALENETQITSIVIPDSVTTIEDEAFSGCTNLQTVTLPDSLEILGYNVFKNCTSLVYNTYETGNYLGNEDNKFLVLVSADTEKANQNQYINVNTNTKIIANHALRDCANVLTITLPEGLISIGRNAFLYCSSINSIKIPNTVKSLGQGIFAGCSSLQSIILPGSVTYIEGRLCDYGTDPNKTLYYQGTIENYLNIETPSVDSYKYHFMSGFNSVYFLDENGSCYYGNDRYSHLTTLVIPDTITTIKKFSFYNFSTLEKVVIPSSVTSIESGAFNYCYSLVEVCNLSSLDIKVGAEDNGCVGCYAKIVHSSLDEDYISTVGDYKVVFDGSIYHIYRYFGNETNLVLPDDINGKDYKISYGVFEKMNLVSVVIPSSVLEIGTQAFYANMSLSSVEFKSDSKLTSIGNSAFSNCTNLSTITIPEGVITIDDYAFYNCTNLATFTIPSTVEVLGSYAFAQTKLSQVSLPSNLEKIESTTFYDCNLLQYNVYENGKYLGNTDNPYVALIGVVDSTNMTSFTINSTTRIVDGLGYSSLTSINIPASVVTIGEDAFRWCESLQSVTFEENSKLLYIEPGSFYNCDGLINIVLPNSVISIEESAFSSCNNLTSVTLSENLQYIGSIAFDSCNSLETIVISKQLKIIEDSAFNHCLSLTTVNYRGTEEEWNNIEIGGSNSYLTRATIVYNYSE